MIIAFVILALLVIAWCVAGIARVGAVTRYRLNLLKQIDTAVRADFKCGIYDFEWRYEAFAAASFEQMSHKLWRSLDSFYPNKTFLLPSREATTDGIFEEFVHPEDIPPEDQEPDYSDEEPEGSKEAWRWRQDT